MALLAGLVFFKATLHDNFVLYFFTSSLKFDLLFCVASVFFIFAQRLSLSLPVGWDWIFSTFLLWR